MSVQTCYTFHPLVKFSSAGSGKCLIYLPNSQSPLIASPSESKIISKLQANSVFSLEVLSSFFIELENPDDPSAFLHWLIDKGIVIESHDSNHIQDTSNDTSFPTYPQPVSSERTLNVLGFRFISTSKYTINLFDLKELEFLHILKRSIDVIGLQARLLPFLILVASFEIYYFYFGKLRALSSITHSPLFANPSLLQVFLCFTLTSFFCVLFRIFCGFSLEMPTTVLKIKLLAGFHPVFDSDDYPPYDQFSTLSKFHYLLITSSSYLMRLYILMLAILFVYIFYPFLNYLPATLLTSLFVLINISLVAIIWQLIPSPGSITFKLLELYNIIPQKLLGKTFAFFRNFFNLSRKAPSLISINLLNTKFFLYFLFLLGFILSIFLKFWFLLNFVFPGISNDLPQVFGYWTPTIILYLLFILSLRYAYYTFSPKNTSPAFSPPSPPKSPFEARTSLDKTSFQRTTFDSKFQTFHSKTFIFKPIFLILILFILFLPFKSAVSGSATVSESSSLDIKSREIEKSFIASLPYSGPSRQVIKKGSTIISLSSPSLTLKIVEAQQTLQSLQSQKSILKIQLQKVSSGSQFQDSLNRDQDLSQAISDLGKYQSQINSYQKQVSLYSQQATSYKKLSSEGAVSTLQYQDIVIQLESARVKLQDSIANFKNTKFDIVRRSRSKNIDQVLKYREDFTSTSDQLKQVDFDLAKQKAILKDLNQRFEELNVIMPFDGVIDSDTTSLLGKLVVYNSDLLSVRSVPLAIVEVTVPEYDRSNIRIGDQAIVKLYSSFTNTITGKIKFIAPKTINLNQQDFVQASLGLDGILPSSYIGSVGTAKIYHGYTCLFWNLLKPFVRFISVDVWSILP